MEVEQKTLKLFKSMVIALLPLLLISCQPKANDNKENSNSNGTTATVNSNEKTSVPNVKQSVFKVGDEVDFGDIIIKVDEIDEKYEDQSISYTTDVEKLVALKITFAVKQDPITDPFEFSVDALELYSSAKRTFKPIIDKGKEPLLISKNINKNQSLTGWVTFIVPKDESITQLAYRPKFFADDMRVVVGLK